MNRFLSVILTALLLCFSWSHTAVAEDLNATDKDLYETVFGIRNGDMSLSNILANTVPPGYIVEFLKLSLAFAAGAFGIVLLITMLRASLDTAKEMEFLGRATDAPTLGLRISLASILLVPIGWSGLTFGFALIMWATGWVTQVNDLTGLNAKTQKAIISDELKLMAVPPSISKETYASMLNMATCREYSAEYERLGRNYIFDPITSADVLDSEPNLFNKKRVLSGFIIPSADTGLTGWLFGADKFKGGCGGVYLETTVIRPDSVGSGPSSTLRPLLQTIDSKSKFIATTLGTLVRKQFTDQGVSGAAPTLRDIAYKVIHEDIDDYSQKDLQRDFNKSHMAINAELARLHKQYVESIQDDLQSKINPILADMADDGWLMAWANAYRLIMLPSIITPLNRFRFDVVSPDLRIQSKGFREKYKDYQARIGEALGVEGGLEAASAKIFQAGGYPVVVSNGDPGIERTVLQYCGNWPCFTSGYVRNTLYLARQLATGDGGTHPLLTLSNYGSTNGDDVFRAIVGAAVANNVTSFAGYALQVFSFGEPFGRLMNKVGDRVYDLKMKALIPEYAIMKMYKLAPAFIILLVGIIVTVDWIVTLLIMVFGVHLFAVFHALPRGQGLTSDYAQRGYPAFIGAIFMPFFNLLALYVMLLVQKYAFKFLGSTYYLGIRSFYDISDVDMVDAILISFFMFAGITAIIRLTMLIGTNWQDRILRVLGVHESLTSGFTPDGATQEMSQRTDQAADGVSKGVAPLPREGGGGRVPALNADGTPTSGQDGGKPPPEKGPGPSRDTAAASGDAMGEGGLASEEHELRDPDIPSEPGGDAGGSSGGASSGAGRSDSPKPIGANSQGVFFDDGSFQPHGSDKRQPPPSNSRFEAFADALKQGAAVAIGAKNLDEARRDVAAAALRREHAGKLDRTNDSDGSDPVDNTGDDPDGATDTSKEYREGKQQRQEDLGDED